MEDNNGNRRSWEKWNTFLTLLLIVGGFLTQGAIYVSKEAERDVKINYLVQQIAEFSANRYTKDDGVKDSKIQEDHYRDLSDRLKQLEYRFNLADHH